MSVTAAPDHGLRAWLLASAPGSRWQARCGNAYLAWLKLRGNPLAMAGLGIIAALLLMVILAPLLAPGTPYGQDLAHRLLPPSGEHWFGTDQLGRDIYTRVVYGAHLTLIIVVLVAILAAPVGLLVGTVAGYVGGIVDTVLMRITDVFLAFPRLVLALAFVAALGPGIENAVIAIALTSWPPYARVARAETLALRSSDFIAAARLQGASPGRIVLRHIVPLCLLFGDRPRHSRHGGHHPDRGRPGLPRPRRTAAIAGMGCDGSSTGRDFILEQWWVATMPGIAIFIVSLGFNLLGDGLRDVLDPKQR